jgi:hypothetical protein
MQIANSRYTNARHASPCGKYLKLRQINNHFVGLDKDLKVCSRHFTIGIMFTTHYSDKVKHPCVTWDYVQLGPCIGWCFTVLPMCFNWIVKKNYQVDISKTRTQLSSMRWNQDRGQRRSMKRQDSSLLLSCISVFYSNFTVTDRCGTRYIARRTAMWRYCSCGTLQDDVDATCMNVESLTWT